MSIYTYPVIDFQLPAYVTNTWNPVLEFNGDSTSIVYDTAQGSYSILYNTVFFNLYIKLASKGINTGNATIIGLPYLAVGVSGDGRMVNYQNMTAVESPGGYVADSSASIILTSSTATNTANLTDANFTDTSEFTISGYYRFSVV